MFDRLVRRAVLAEADAVVREDVDDAQLHQRGHADRVARVVAEGQEGAAVGDEAAVQRDAVHHRRHAEFAHAIVDVAAALGAAAHRAASREVGQVGAGQVGAAAEQFGQPAAPASQAPSAMPCGSPAPRGSAPNSASIVAAPSRSKSAGSSPAMRRSNSAASAG